MGIFCGLCAGRRNKRKTVKKADNVVQMTPAEKKAQRIKVAKFAAALFFPIFLETMDYTGMCKPYVTDVDAKCAF